MYLNNHTPIITTLTISRIIFGHVDFLVSKFPFNFDFALLSQDFKLPITFVYTVSIFISKLLRSSCVLFIIFHSNFLALKIICSLKQYLDTENGNLFLAAKILEILKTL